MKTKPQRPKIYGMQKSNYKREVYTNTSSMRKQKKKISKKRLKLIPKGTIKRMKSKVS